MEGGGVMMLVKDDKCVNFVMVCICVVSLVFCRILVVICRICVVSVLWIYEVELVFCIDGVIEFFLSFSSCCF